MARVDRQLIAGLHDAPYLVDVRDVEVGLDALTEQVQRQGNEVHVACALAIPEQRAFDSFCARHKRQLGGGDGGAPVVVRMHAEDEAVPPADVSMAPLDLVRVNVWGTHLYRRRQVEDHLLLRGGLPDVDDRVRDLLGKVELGAREALRRVFEDEFGRLVVGRQALDQRGAADRDCDDAIPVEAEDHPTLQGRCRVVQVHDGAASARHALEGALNQLLPGLGQDLDGDVVGDQTLLDEQPHEVEVELRGGRKTDLDLLEADPHQDFEEAPFAMDIHRVD